MWLIYAIVGAGFKAFTALLQKRISSKVNPWVYAWITATLTLPMVYVLTLFGNHDPFGVLQSHWFAAAATALIWNLVAVVSIMALKREQLSYIVPLTAFIPIFTLVVAWIGLGETIPFVGLVGVVTVFVGSYIVNIEPKQVGWLGPVLRLATSSGARYSIAGALLLAINNVISKGALNDGVNSFEWLFVISVFSWIWLLHVPFRYSKQVKDAISKHSGLLFAVSVFIIGSGLFAILAISSTVTSYALSVRRLDILFSILLGWKLLKETNIRNKLIGSVLMIVGIVIIAAA